MAEPWTGRLEQLRLRLPAAQCRACADAASTALTALPGVLRVDVAEGSGEVVVTYDRSVLDVDELRQVSGDAGCTDI